MNVSAGPVRPGHKESATFSSRWRARGSKPPSVSTPEPGQLIRHLSRPALPKQLLEHPLPAAVVHIREHLPGRCSARIQNEKPREARRGFPLRNKAAAGLHFGWGMINRLARMTHWGPKGSRVFRDFSYAPGPSKPTGIAGRKTRGYARQDYSRTAPSDTNCNSGAYLFGASHNSPGCAFSHNWCWRNMASTSLTFLSRATGSLAVRRSFIRLCSRTCSFGLRSSIGASSLSMCCVLR
jgi:hypothetical protein